MAAPESSLAAAAKLALWPGYGLALTKARKEGKKCRAVIQTS